MRRLFAPLVLVLAAGLSAQSRQQADVKKPEQGIVVVGKYLTVRATANPRSAAPGARVTLALDVTPGKEIHVYAPGQAGYIPIELTLDKSDDFKSVPARFPAPRSYYFEPLKETVKVYDQPFRITLEVTLADSPAFRARAVNKQTLSIIGMLDYQACDHAVCYRPEQLALQWPITLAPSVASITRIIGRPRR